MNRIRNKITEHLGGEDGVEELLYTSAQDMIYQLAVDDDLLLPKDSELNADGSTVNMWVENMEPEDRKSD
jgi:hypothetical protein